MAEGPQSKAPPPTNAAIAVVEVGFREVTSLFDLHGRRRVIAGDHGPVLLYDLMRFDPTVVSGGRYRSEAADGRSRVTGGLPGVHQVVEIEGFGVGLCTFSRPHATSIAGKWIYMFASTDDAGGGMKLEHEMYADADQLQLVDLAAHAGKNVRPATATKRRTIPVEVRSINNPNRWVWFLLAPYQISWARLAEMVANGKRLASRCQRLFDEFWTDGHDGTAARPLSELQDAAQANGKLGYVMYLLDPLAEAVRRATYYNLLHDAWQAAATKLAADDEYRLAKRVHALPPKYVDDIWPKLGTFLHEAEKNTRPLLALTSARLEDLLWWVARPRRRTGTSLGRGRPPIVSDTWYVGTASLAAPVEQKGDRQQYNAFAELVADYGHADTSDETVKAVGGVVALVHARLGSLPDGQAFLAKIMHVALDGTLPLADGGASMLFEAKRKGTAATAEVASVLLERYANAWVAAYRRDALPRLVEFARKRLAIELRLRHPHDVARAMASIERRAANKAAKGGIERLAAHYHVEADPTSVRALGLSKPVLDRLALGFEAFNLAASLQALRDEKDAWAAIGLLGSTLDAYSAVTKIYPEIERVQFRVGKTAVTFEIASKLSILSSAIDVVLGAREAIKATDPTVRSGHIMRTMGAYLVLGGTIFRATPAGAVLTVVGLALQALGAAVAAGTDHLRLFIQYCRWGDPIPLDGVMGISLDGKGLGYAGKLVDLHRDITAQHRALDWLFYRFDPSARVFDGAGLGVPSRIFLKMNPPEGLGPDAKWTVRVDVVARDGGALLKRYEYQATTPEDHVSLSSNDEIAILSHDTARPHSTASMSARYDKVRLRGTLQLDVFGDGQSMVTRQLDVAMDLPF